MSTLLALALVCGLSAALPLTASAEGGSYVVTEHPAGATYMQYATAIPIKATFELGAYHNASGPDVNEQAPMTIQWYWSDTNLNTNRDHGLGPETINYDKILTFTHTPDTSIVGIRYYYAVLKYEAFEYTATQERISVQKEDVTNPAKIEVKAPTYDFRVKKVDENGNPLAGAVLKLEPQPNADFPGGVPQTYEVTTGTDGNALFSTVEGYYILSEKQAPAGYTATDEKYNIRVTANGISLYDPKTQEYTTYETVTFVNKKAPGAAKQDFKVKKVDENGNLLAGAVLALVPQEALNNQDLLARTYQATSGADGYASFSAEAGDYILSEKQAPAGYNATDDKYNIRITASSVSIVNPQTQTPTKYETVTFVNKKIPTLNKEDHFAFMQGYPDNTFRPARNMTRAEFATLAAHFDNLTLTSTNDFTDVPASHWAVKYITSAAAKGWIVGYDEGGVKTFKPEANITRAEVVTLVGRMLNRTADSAYLAANLSSLPRVYTDITAAHWAYLAIMEASTGHDYTRDSAGEHWTAVYK
jgi:hypothetical protein